MSMLAKRAALLADLSLLPDGDERFGYLLAAGRRVPALNPTWKTDDRLLPGCVSRLWLYPQYRDGRCYFHLDADAEITKGIAAVVCGFYSGETPAEIISVGVDFLGEAGITQVLSPNRSNGLASLRRHIAAFAHTCLS